MGVIITLIGFAGYALPFLRNVETILPDHDLASAGEPAQTVPAE